MDENLRDQEVLNFYFTKEGLEDCTQPCVYFTLQVRYRDQNHKFNFTMSQFISGIFTFVLNSTMLCKMKGSSSRVFKNEQILEH